MELMGVKEIIQALGAMEGATPSEVGLDIDAPYEFAEKYGHLWEPDAEGCPDRMEPHSLAQGIGIGIMMERQRTSISN